MVVEVSIAATSQECRAQWVQTDAITGGYVTALAVIDTILFAGTYYGEVYRSTDGGTHWTLVTSGLTKSYVNCFAVSGENLYAATMDGAFLSTNNGTSWTEVDSGLTERYVRSLAVAGTTLFASTIPPPHALTGGGVFRSTDDGRHWTTAGLADTIVLTLSVNDSILIAGCQNSGVFVSSNQGSSWHSINQGLPTGSTVTSLAFSGAYLYCGVDGYGLYRSADYGSHWDATAFVSVYGTHCISVLGSNLFVGVGVGLFVSRDNGANWTEFSDGLTDRHVLSQTILAEHLYIGTLVGVFRRRISEMLTSADLPVDILPVGFSLHQNYPNPFNPTTTIGYGLSSRTKVLLAVLNTLGQRVATLVSGEQEAGYHEVKFDASALTSGVYLYQLQAGSYVGTKRLLLIR